MSSFTDGDGVCNPGMCSGAVENCTNGIDDDADGDIDCVDTDCASDPACIGGGP